VLSVFATFVAMPVRVIVADDRLLFRMGLERVLEDDRRVDVVAVCKDLPSLEEAVETTDPDVVLTDMRMPPGNTDEGIRFALELRSSHPDIGVIVLTQYAEPEYALRLLAEGSDRRGYLLKESVAERAQLVSAIESVAGGGSVVDPAIIDDLVTAKEAVADSPLAKLTPREKEVLTEIAHGKSNTAIAASLFLTKRSVEKHINSIYTKLDLLETEDVSKRVAATLLFLSQPGADPELTSPAK
jgi:DNA-binding NarL/FixJ family response regulator